MNQWWKSGAPWIWLNGGAVSISIIMVFGLLALILVRGFGHFWPHNVLTTTYLQPGAEQVQVVGQVRKTETLTAKSLREAGVPLPEDQQFATRHLLKLGNRDVTGHDFTYFVADFMGEWSYPGEITVLERREWGNFFGEPLRLLEQGEVVVEGDALWGEFQARLERGNALFDEVREIERGAIGTINYQLERVRLAQRRAELRGNLTPELEREFADQRDALNAQYAELSDRLTELLQAVQRDSIVMRVAGGEEIIVGLNTIISAWQPNSMSVSEKIGFYAKSFYNFIFGYPREANTEGGIFPAIFGTIVMVLVMSIIVTPFGVLAAIYLREYAKQGPLLRAIRISVYNLAGVPSIVFGVFGLGFFVYVVGGSIDSAFYPEALPAPTFGTPGLFWASLTLALLTLPVVIVSTEEGLSRIPSTIRQGSLALGATKSETLWKVVVPLATPAMMTGLILAIARAAGEVAPLMLVGVVKLAPTLPIDGNFPFIHLERKIMHLGFHIYDVGFQSPHAEAAEALVYATALILVLLIVVLNLSAITIRNHLREKYRSESD
jgi:phosphate transport system permease protein